ncbi:MAG: Phosphoglucosamine mutase [Planctomycetes bacterium ADurb.Bin126]|nr:MAG: Phosphoglucosamine mutase [Planctomycetes bacterium ADurb.Bin126]HQL74627.1 phosphoglucosamine mutase [Phycisphaerae bacterium]
MDRLMVSVSGVRGMIGGTLTPHVACEFGCAFAAMLGAGKKVAIGRDTRTSGPMIRNAVAAGLLAGGVHVVDLGVVSTPGAAFMTARLGCDGGVVITASHNPIEYNGIKFLQPTGTGLSAGDAERLKQIWQARQWSFAGPLEQGEETRDGRTAGQHVSSVLSAVDIFAIADKRFKVVLDSVNGAGCVEAPVLLGKLGCEYKHLNAEGTGRFAHPPEPVEENLRELCQAVKAQRAAVGFAQDADADRLAIVDEKGVFIGEEYTLALATAFVLRKRKGAIATNLATSRMVDDIAAAAGCRVVRSPTGEANVVDAMCREGCIFGGEGGGGVIEPRVVPVRDSLVGMAYLLQQMAETGKTVSQLVAEIPRYVMVKTKQPCPQEAVADILTAAREAFAGDADVRFNDQDGLRIDLAQAWVSVRASNTEPIIRVMGEARDRATIETLIQRVRSVVQAVLA